jgi:hypothetical protein
MMWAQLIEAVAERLRGSEPGLDVREGADAEVPQARRVAIIRGPGTAQPEFAETGMMDQVLYVECWEHDQDAALANRRLAELEAHVHARLLEHAPLLEGWATSVNVETVQPDNDQFRPSVGSRTTVRIRVRKARNP